MVQTAVRSRPARCKRWPFLAFSAGLAVLPLQVRAAYLPLTPDPQFSSALISGQTTLGNGATVVFQSSPNYANSAPLFVKSTLAGSGTTGTNPVAVVWVPTDSAQVTTGNISGFLVNMSMTSGSSGFRNGINVDLKANTSGITGADVLPIVGTGTISANVGGTNLSLAGVSGIAWGGNFVAQILSGATNLQGVIGQEIDVISATGSSARRKGGLQIVKPSNDAVQGVLDYALTIHDQVGAASWKNGLLFGLADGQWSFDTNGTLIGAMTGVNYLSKPLTAGYGMDFVETSFSKNFLRSRGFSVDGAGVTQIGVGLLSPTGTGMSVDASGTIATAVAVSAGGTGYASNDIIYFSNGGIAKVTGVSGGIVSALTVINYPVLAAVGSIPSNPVATTTWALSSGTGLTVNITWDSTRTTLALNPGGGPVTVGGAFNAAGVAQGAVYWANASTACTWAVGTDVSTCINDVVAKAQASPIGGKIEVPAGSYNLGAAVAVTKGNVWFEGGGGALINHDVGVTGSDGGTTFTWTGSAGGTMFSFAPVADAVNGQNIANQRFDGFTVKCANSAAVGVLWASSSRGRINSTITECTTADLLMDTIALGEFNDPQNNEIWLTFANTTNTGTGLVLDGTNAGATNGNTSFNQFRSVTGKILNGDGIHINYADHNRFDLVKITRAGGGTGNATILNGSNSSAGHVGYAESFDLYSTNAPTIARGTTSFTFPSFSNVINNLDQTNATPLPTIETGATMVVRIDSGKFIPPLQIAQIGAPTGTFIGGGSAGQTTNGQNSCILAGSGNATNGFGSCVTGQNTTVNATNEWAAGSNHTTVSGASESALFGDFGNDHGRRTTMFLSPGKTNTAGDHQRSFGGLQAVVPGNATAVRLTADAGAASATNCINVPNSGGYALTGAYLLAFDRTTTTKSFSAVWGGSTAPHIIARSVGAGTTLVDGVTSTIAADATRSNGTLTGIGATIQADTTTGCLNMTFTPPTSNTDTWTLSGGVDTLEGL